MPTMGRHVPYVPRVGGRNSPATASSRCSSEAGWSSSTRPSTSRMGRKVALKILASELADDDRFRERFLRNRASRPRSTTRTSSRSTTPARRMGCLYIAMHYVAGSRPQGPHCQGGAARARSLRVDHDSGREARSTPRIGTASSIGTSSQGTSWWFSGPMRIRQITSTCRISALPSTMSHIAR